MGALWRFLQIKKNREILAWFGGGAVIVAGGIWTVMTFFWDKTDKPAPAAQVVGTGIANSGTQTINGPVDIRGPSPPDPAK